MTPPGRNEPCPCGSGKKYKKCHGRASTPINHAPQKTDTIRLNEEVAYIGNIGEKRKEFCTQFTRHKKSVFEKISQKQKALTAERGETISCAKGCSHCCSYFILSSIKECEPIVSYLYDHPEKLRTFLKNYEIWDKQVGENESLYDDVERQYTEVFKSKGQNVDITYFRRSEHAYYLKNIRCPFLVNNECSIYEVRPWICANHIAVTPQDYCKPQSTINPKTYALEFADLDEEEGPDFYFGDNPNHSGALPILVYRLLHNGYVFLSSLPGFEGLKQEIINTPEIRTHMREISKGKTG